MMFKALCPKINIKASSSPVAVANQGVYEVRADKTGTAGHQDVQFVHFKRASQKVPLSEIYPIPLGRSGEPNIPFQPSFGPPDRSFASARANE